jgi:hypothetical protein
VSSGDEIGISFLERKFGQKVFDDMSVTLGDKRPSYSTAKNWIASFRTGYLSTEYENVL